jgi:hypothetical protein
MMGDRRALCMEHGGQTDPHAEVLRVGRDGDERLGRGLEQEAVDDGLVVVGDIGASLGFLRSLGSDRSRGDRYTSHSRPTSYGALADRMRLRARRFTLPQPSRNKVGDCQPNGPPKSE